MTEIVVSSLLNATFTGTVVTRKMGGRDESILQYRGIKYGHIPKRFAKALPKDDWNGQNIDSTKFGPRCPQNAADIDHLFRVPYSEGEVKDEKEDEDEFECLNLVISQPRPRHSTQEKLPVLIWIHGGAQVVSFGSAASKCGDPFKLAVDSTRLGMPIIVVSLNYRLNIFAFGDGEEINLGLSDQQLGIEWVKKHIADFGGDMNNITLYGQSAGAVYSHANMLTVSGIKRGILSSGSLYLSPLLPRERGQTYIHNIAAKVQSICGKSLKDAPVDELLKALRELNVNGQWMQEEESLEDWRDKMEQVEYLMIGDVEYESVLWRNGIEQLSPDEIIAAFKNNLNPEDSSELLRLYGIYPDRPTASKIGALDFLGDLRYGAPVERIVSKWKDADKPVHRYVFDQVNPWQASSRAHHAVELMYLFGGYDESLRHFYGKAHNPAAFKRIYEKVCEEMRRSWINFVNGKEPWDGSTDQYRAFGPHGDCKSIDEGEFAARRRVCHFEVLESKDPVALDKVSAALAIGRLSWIN